MVRILLVEDSMGDASLARSTLEQADSKFVVTIASSIREATQALPGGYDAILLDLTLTDSGGLGTYSRMRAAAGGLPIVVLTGRNDAAMERSCMEAGAAAYLIKGQANRAELIRVLNEVTARVPAGEIQVHPPQDLR